MVIIESDSDISWRITVYTSSDRKKTPGLKGLGKWEGEGVAKLKRDLERSWAQSFREDILPHLPAEEVGRKLYSHKNGRPSNDVQTLLGLCVIQEQRNYTDQETVDSLKFGNDVQHALGIDIVNDETCHLVRKSFWDFKKKMRDNKMHDFVFDKVTMEIQKVFKVNTAFVRMDSVNISSNMRTLTRANLFFKTVENFLNKLKTKDIEAFDSIDSSMIEPYFQDKTGYEIFGGSKPSDRAAILKSIAIDAHDLIEMFSENEKVNSMPSFQTLKRLMVEQCKIVRINETNGEVIIELLDSKDVKADTLQSPFDTEAGFDAHKPEGRYQVQVAETFQDPDAEEKAEGGSEKALSLVLHVNTESAANHDSHAVIPAINDMLDKGVELDTLLADTAYGGNDNVEFAKDRDIKLVSPVPGKKVRESVDSTANSTEADMEQDVEHDVESPNCFSILDFKKDEDGRIVSCPMGQAAVTTENKKKTKLCSSFNIDTCRACPCIGKCPVKVRKFRANIYYTLKIIKLAERRRTHETPEFKRLYRKRSGIEATNSLLARRYAIKRLRVRGLKAVSCSVTFKVLALNADRVASYKRKKAK